MGLTLREQLVQFNTSKAEPLHALLCLPGVALPLILGVSLGYPGTAVLMAGGAQCVAFGSFQQPLFRKSGAMIIATVGIALAATAGALCRDSTAALLIAASLCGFLFAISNAVSASTAWVAQQCCIFLVISSAAPSSPGTTHDLLYSALLRGAGVLVGGALQTAFLTILLNRLPRAQTQFTNPDFDPTHFQLDYLRSQLLFGSASLQFALRMVVTALVSVSVYRSQTWASAYWIGMTALLLPKPDFSGTVQRALLRAAGTMLGAALCTLIVVAVRPRGEVLAALTLIFLFGSYLLFNVNYGVFSVALTGYICFILAIAHNPPAEVLQHRVLATLIGAAIAIGVNVVFIAGRRILGIATPYLHSMEERM